MNFKIIFFFIGSVLTITFMILNIIESIKYYRIGKKIDLEPYIYGILTLALIFKIPYVKKDLPLLIYFCLAITLSFIVTIIYTLAKIKNN